MCQLKIHEFTTGTWYLFTAALNEEGIHDVLLLPFTSHSADQTFNLPVLIPIDENFVPINREVRRHK